MSHPSNIARALLHGERDYEIELLKCYLAEAHSALSFAETILARAPQISSNASGTKLNSDTRTALAIVRAVLAKRDGLS